MLLGPELHFTKGDVSMVVLMACD